MVMSVLIQLQLASLLTAHQTIVRTIVELDRITVDPNRVNGQPCIRDLQLSVRRVLELLAL
jgi:uncharacterized protein (DUF433 family)